MADIILANFGGLEDINPEWLVLSGFNPKVRTGLDELKSRATDNLIYALIPGDGFSCYQLDIRIKNHKKILQAARFALVDKVLDNFDDLFLAIDHKKGAKVWVAQSVMLEKWLEHINNLDLCKERTE